MKTSKDVIVCDHTPNTIPPTRVKAVHSAFMTEEVSVAVLESLELSGHEAVERLTYKTSPERLLVDASWEQLYVVWVSEDKNGHTLLIAFLYTPLIISQIPVEISELAVILL